MIPDGPLHGAEFVGGLLLAALAVGLTRRLPRWRALALFVAAAVVTADRLGEALIDDVFDHEQVGFGIAMIAASAAVCGILALVDPGLGLAAALSVASATWAVVPDTEMAVIVVGVLLGAQGFVILAEREPGLIAGPWGSALLGTLPAIAAVTGSIGRPNQLFVAGVWSIVAVAVMLGAVWLSVRVFPAPSRRPAHRR